MAEQVSEGEYLVGIQDMYSLNAKYCVMLAARIYKDTGERRNENVICNGLGHCMPFEDGQGYTNDSKNELRIFMQDLLAQAEGEAARIDLYLIGGMTSLGQGKGRHETSIETLDIIKDLAKELGLSIRAEVVGGAASKKSVWIEKDRMVIAIQDYTHKENVYYLEVAEDGSIPGMPEVLLINTHENYFLERELKRAMFDAADKGKLGIGEG